MHAEDPNDPTKQGDPRARNLREAGFYEAAEYLAELAAYDAERAAEQEEVQRREAAPPGFPLMPGAVFDSQAEIDGRGVLDALEKFKGDRTLSGSMPLLHNLDKKGGR